MAMKRIVLLLLCTPLLTCLTGLASKAQDKAPDPTKGEVPLECAAGWNAFLLMDRDVGVWTVRSFQVFPKCGCPEVVGLDDRGRCTILLSYSGRWTPLETIQDGQWLGTVVGLDLDPHLPGRQLYTGGKTGRLYQIHARPGGGFDTRIVAEFPGEEIHTLVGGRLRSPDSEPQLLVITRTGKVFLPRPGKRPGDPFQTRLMATLQGRVRHAVVVQPGKGDSPFIATVSRAQEVSVLRVQGDKLEHKTILREPMGFGRIAQKPPAAGKPTVLYVTRDDGVVLRLEQKTRGAWKREMIYAGPQGPRGVAAGRFHEDPGAETVAVYGYSKKVQLLTRLPGEAWKAETIFTDVDKGHSLTAAELDGRNATHEILGSGYGKRIFMLARPPGYGLEVVAVEPDEQKDAKAEKDPDGSGLAVTRL